MAGLHRGSWGAGAGDAAAAAQQGQHGGEKRRIAVLACGGVCESAALKIKKTIELIVKGGKSGWRSVGKGRGCRRAAGLGAGARGGREGVRRERCCPRHPAASPTRRPRGLHQHQGMAQPGLLRLLVEGGWMCGKQVEKL